MTLLGLGSLLFAVFMRCFVNSPVDFMLLFGTDAKVQIEHFFAGFGIPVFFCSLYFILVVRLEARGAIYGQTFFRNASQWTCLIYLCYSTAWEGAQAYVRASNISFLSAIQLGQLLADTLGIAIGYLALECTLHHRQSMARMTSST